MNYDRQYRFAAGIGTGFEVGDSPSYPIHISFSIEKTEKEAENTAKISLWNLSKEQIGVLNEDDCVVTLRAGYGANIPVAFVGNVTFAVTDTDNADKETKIEAADGRKELRDTWMSVCYDGTIDTKKIFDDIAAKMGVSVIYGDNVTFTELSAFSFVGGAGAALDRMCASTGLAWSLQNGVLNIRRPQDAISHEVYVLSGDTGLIGIPKILTEAAKNSKKKKESGIEVEYLMNAAIGVSDYIFLESEIRTGFFRVASVKIDGDNYADDWKCTAKLMEAGNTPKKK